MKNKRNIGRLFISFFLAVIFTTCLSVVSSPIVSALEIPYSEGFETDNGGYAHMGSLDQWEWGTPTSGPGSAHSGSNCWATNLDGDVPRYATSNSYLTSPPIPVRALGANEIARVRFYGWIQIDEMFDRGEFQVSSNGATWETKAEFFYIMQGTWTEYYFDVSDYAGGNIYLRFRLYADSQEAFWIEKSGPPPYPSVNMAGWYIDDLAIEITETPAIETTLTLEAWENQGSLASCPWVYTWDGAEFVKDNDVYSTARGEAKEFTDYYTLNKLLVPKDGQYLLELRETEGESSYTDLVQLITIDHAAGVEVAADDNGNVLTYSSPSQPDSATDDQGNNVLSEAATEDDAGFNGYNDDYIVLDFSSLDITNGATLVLNVQGFQTDSDGEGEPTSARPWIHIQTQDATGDWVTRNEFYPRMEWSTSAYDLSGYMETSQMVRLYITSCHEGKYHIVDYVGLDTSSQAPTTTTVLSATSAVHSINGDVLNLVDTSDDTYASMAPLESTAFAFDTPELVDGQERDFVFVSEGYYVPMGTFFIYTWDGTGWAQRDAWSVEVNSDQTRNFDLSLWLPDPNGEYKVRIWQDYWYQNARIDYVGLTQDSVLGTLDTATDLRNVANRDVVGPTPWDPALVKARVSASDNQYMLYAQEPSQNYYTGPNGYVQRDRWLEVTWTGLTVNVPPTTNPVIITDETTSTPTISWTYSDADSDPQAQYEVEVWTGLGGTGTNVWDPAIGTGTGDSVVYAGSALTPGQIYYARVKAFDGTSWGSWSEASWTFPANQPPVADINGPYTGNEGSPIGFDATGSSDPDGDPLTYAWDLDNDGQYDDATGPTPSYTWNDNYGGTVSVEVSDGQATDTASTTVTVNNVAPTITGLTVTPGLVAVGETVTLDATFTDPGSDTHTADIDWDNDGICDDTEAVTSPISELHSYTDAGVFTVKLTVTDDDGGSDTEVFQYIVVYDPNDGFVTGGGWINSPAGAYADDPNLEGTANFGFVSKYKKGASTPTGQTEFQFHAASLNFHSSSYEWLVIAHHKAMYNGVGTINGAGNYGFMLTAIDAKLTPSTDVDLFRMKIWDKDNGDAIVYDNQLGDADDADPTTAIAGGQIIIHTK